MDIGQLLGLLLRTYDYKAGNKECIATINGICKIGDTGWFTSAADSDF